MKGFDVTGFDVMGFNDIGWDVGMELGISDGCGEKGVGYHNREKNTEICINRMFKQVNVCRTFTVGLAEGEELMEGAGKEVGARVGYCVKVTVGARVGNMDGFADGPLLTQAPLWQVPKGIELQGVASGTYCGEGQLLFELQDTVTSQSLSLPHRQSRFDASL